MLEVVRTTVIAPSLATRFSAASLAASIHGATAKTTPVNADEIPLADSAASYALKKVTFANFKVATLASAALTGNPTAPTPSTGDNDTSIATTAFVKAAIAVGGVNPGTDVSASVAAAAGFSVLRTIALRAADEPFIEDVGSPVSGDWTAVLQAAVAESIVFRGRHGTTYTVTSPIAVTLGGNGFIFPRSAKIYLPASAWTSTKVAETATSVEIAAASLFYVHGNLLDANDPIYNFTLRGLTIESEVAENRFQYFVDARNVRGLDICDNEMFGGATGVAIGVATCSGHICRNYIHDWLQDDDSVFAVQPQTTGIEIDHRRVDGTISNQNSNDLIVSENIIVNLQFTGDAAASWQYQTDGINHKGLGQSSDSEGTAQSGGAVIANNRIRGVGEGIDCFASNVAITGNVIEDCAEYGVKIIHGASNCSITGGSIRRAGRAGIVITSTVNGDCIGNAISGVTIEDINPDNRVFSPDIQTACITIGGGDPRPAHDTVITGCVLDPGDFGEYVINDLGYRTRYGSDNAELQGGSVGRYYTFYSRSLVPSGGRAAFMASNAGGGQSGITGGVATDVDFGNVVGSSVYQWGDCFASSIWTPPAGHFRGGASVRITGTFTAGLLAGIVIARDPGIGSYGTLVARQVPCPVGSSLTFTVDIEFEDISDGTYHYKVQAYAAVSAGTVSFPADGSLTRFWARMT